MGDLTMAGFHRGRRRQVSPPITRPRYKVGDRVRISRVNQEEALMLAYLGERGLVPGRSFEIKEVRALDGVVTVEDETGKSYSLGEPIAGSILVQDVSESAQE